VMQAGRVVETAPAGQLFAAPQHEYTRMLLASTLEDSPPRAARRGAVPAPAPASAPQPVSHLGGDR
jgi:peptide/nickel transport system permease protein